MTRSCWAGANASRLTILRRKVLVVDAVDAQSAFLHHAMVVVVFTGTIGACPGAELAADAGVGIDEHDPILCPFVRRARRTDGDACCVLAMEAGTGKVHDVRIR